MARLAAAVALPSLIKAAPSLTPTPINPVWIPSTYDPSFMWIQRNGRTDAVSS